MDQHERELLQKIIKAQDGLIMDGTWGGFGEDSGVVSTGGAQYADLLLDSRRPPEMVVILKCGENQSLERLIDKQAIVDKFNDIEKKREELKVKKRADDAQKKRDERAEELKAENEGADPPKTEQEIEAAIQETMDAWN